MKIVYVTNGMGLHSKAISDALYTILGKDFVFIDIRKPNEGPASIHKDAEKGMDYSNIEYIFHAMRNEETQTKALELIDEADIALCSGKSRSYIKRRLSKTKITFSISERWLKKPKYQISLFGWFSLFHNLIKLQSPYYYHLALGAYCANDASFLHIFKDKMYKFAYLVPIEKYDVKQSVENRRKESVEILWCSRFIDWKHPELVTHLAKNLVDDGYRHFHITMVGAKTSLQDVARKYISDNNLDQFVAFKDGMPNYAIRSLMKESNIFLLTSDHKEGWGVVLNEALGAGCAVVASSQAGATPFLIRQEENGLIFQSNSLESLTEKVKRLLDDREFREKIAISGYKTITEEWGADIVAERFITLCNNLLQRKQTPYASGPCSRATICREDEILSGNFNK